ncbi:tetratricopeptide repeat protein [Armatimonas sp.]|uniref:tetratricopeptide repeat protein n=1 Tax=Armatimonas sp. TaxID=1872638 RepID=UPI00374D25C0
MSELPVGTITFLFTDIEGSTRLWEEHPETMRLALARHDALLREVIARHNGHVFKTIGDAFCVAFYTAPEALNATLDAQRTLITESWPAQTPLKVRMALHTGEAESRDGDYFGQPLNRVTRLLSASHGGQVLLSHATQALLGDNLPDSVSLRNLGLHQLKDLTSPEQVYQLRHPTLPDNFPPIKSLSTHPNNLPQQLTRFIGREKELAEIKEHLTTTRLLCLTGSGGSGKTRLSLQLAADTLELYPEGVWLIELASLTDPERVTQTVAGVLGIKEAGGKPILTTLTESVKDKYLLLLLDNCEHLLDASARLAEAVIGHCPHVQILATSRERLRIAGETTYRVPSLSLPDPKQVQTLESISPFESVRLFIDRTLQAQPHFMVTNANAPALAAICFQLDGIPLAIELAAARTHSLSIEEINQRLDHRFRLLTGGSRTALPRQQTLRSLIDWSYNLLTGAEKALLRRLCVFAGGWTLSAAESVCTDDLVADEEVLDLLTSLVDKSLVLAEQQQGQTRFRLLETIRQYARDCLLDSGEDDWTRGKHRDYFVALGEKTKLKLLGPEQGKWFNRLEDEHENLRVSLDWSLQGRGTEAMRLGIVLFWFWVIRGYSTEAQEWYERILEMPAAQERTAQRAELLRSASEFARLRDTTLAQTYQQQALTISRELKDRESIGWALYALGKLAPTETLACAYYEEALLLWKEVGNKRGVGLVMSKLAYLTLEEGNFTLAQVQFEEILTLSQELGDLIGIAEALSSLGQIAKFQGDSTLAQQRFEESLAQSREIGHNESISSKLTILGELAIEQEDYSLARTHLEENLVIEQENKIPLRARAALLQCDLGYLAYFEGDYSAAIAYWQDSLSLREELDMFWKFSYVIAGFGLLAGRNQATENAARLWGAGEKLREGHSASSSLFPHEKLKQEVAQARAAFADDATFDAAWLEGRTLTLEQAIALAQQPQGEPYASSA